MGFRTQITIGGLFLVVASYFVGYWTAWVGITLLFFSAVMYFLDKE